MTYSPCLVHRVQNFGHADQQVAHVSARALVRVARIVVVFRGGGQHVRMQADHQSPEHAHHRGEAARIQAAPTPAQGESAAGARGAPGRGHLVPLIPAVTSPHTAHVRHLIIVGYS